MAEIFRNICIVWDSTNLKYWNLLRIVLLEFFHKKDKRSVKIRRKKGVKDQVDVELVRGMTKGKGILANCWKIFPIFDAFKENMEFTRNEC